MKPVLFPLLASVVLFSSCLTTLDSALNSYREGGEAPLTEKEVAKGLKEALTRGADAAVRELAKKDGYYGDALYRLVLPPEANPIIENIERVPGGKKMMDDLVLRINRSAEEAASGAYPIFADAVTDMTIADAFAILKGNDDAATQYFRSKTYTRLVDLYRPKLNGALDKKLVGDISANDTWNALRDLYNKAAASPVGKLNKMKTVDIELSRYLTEKALDGMFLKVADEEKAIRKDPVKRVTQILKRVFGSLD